MEKTEVEKNWLKRQGSILKLRKLKMYDDIYYIYGSRTYLDYAPHSYRKKDLKKLMREKRYIDVHSKYGNGTFRRRIAKIMANDVHYEIGSKIKANTNFISAFIRRQVLPVFLAIGIGISSLFTIGPGYVGTNISKENAITYSKEIEDYNDKITKYAKEINALGLNDKEIVMKVIDDMWRDIGGYGEPVIDAGGYFRLDLAKINGVGKCRHMADDVAAKLNEIDPDYNARIFTVLSNYKEFELANIETKSINNIEFIEPTAEQLEANEKITDVVGNHMVTFIDLKSENITLVIDPTNPGLGVVINGEIHTFSSPDGKGLELKYFGTAVTGLEGISDYIEIIKSSFFNSNKDLESLRQEYGIESQNRILSELRQKGLVRPLTELSDNIEKEASVSKEIELKKEALIAIINSYESMPNSENLKSKVR